MGATRPTLYLYLFLKLLSAMSENKIAGMFPAVYEEIRVIYFVPLFWPCRSIVSLLLGQV